MAEGAHGAPLTCGSALQTHGVGAAVAVGQVAVGRSALLRTGERATVGLQVKVRTLALTDSI